MQQEREKAGKKKKKIQLNIYHSRQSDGTACSLFVSSHETFALDRWCKWQKKSKKKEKKRNKDAEIV